jgi:very-short-patch-repair endonuclease
MAYLGKTRHPAYLYNADPETIEIAKLLRKRMTPSEKLLWEKLRRKKIFGVKFRRQHPIGFYIADFYCHDLCLVIEVDGSVHDRLEQKEHDENRSAEMDRLGIKVVRFTNNEIKNHIGSVMQHIRNEIFQRRIQRYNDLRP